MTWWRRDPSLSPINRYAQRLLRSHESALRTRCFSRTPVDEAQHEDNNGDKRPEGMSNLEWAHLQNYTRWRKRFTEDPYQALFGASHDMLNGKGLKDWDWISKTFPKWMLTEMETVENQGTPSKQSTKPDSDNQYPKRIDIVNEKDNAPSRNESHFRQPSIRATRLDRADSIGIASPSDLRRPREQAYFRVVGQQPPVVPLSNTPKAVPQPPRSPEALETSGVQPLPDQYPVKAQVSTHNDETSKPSPIKEDSSMDPSYYEEFLADQYHRPETRTTMQHRRSIWRQTALDRRSEQLPKTTAENASDPEISPKEQSTAPPVPTPAPRPIIKAKRIPYSVEPEDDHVVAESVSEPAAVEGDTSRLDANGVTHRSTSAVLKKLPQDDIDFLSADDIRASMGGRRSRLLSSEEKTKARQDLEATFCSSHQTGQNIHPTLEAKIKNDQYIRRLERELKSPQQEPAYFTQTDRREFASEPSVSEAPIGGTIDRLVNLVSSHFWQTPAEPESIQKTRVFFEQFLTRVRRGRNAMKHISEDLEKDVPASKGLLKLVAEGDDMLDSTVRKVQRLLDSGDRKATVSSQKVNEKLRDRIRHTDVKLEAAFASLLETEVPKNVLPSFERRLRTASRVATRHLELTRQIAWSMQTHLEDPEIDRTILSGYQAVANTLLVAKHTQLAITLLLDRTMQHYGVEKSGDDATTAGSSALSSSAGNATQSLETTMSEVDKAQLRAKIVAEERLAHEVDAQVSAMKGLSDDGYSRAPKLAPQKSLEECGPLVHSLFRPFGPVIESLGKEVSPEALVLQEAEKKKAIDAKLIAEVKEVYEDTYGPITVEHTQLANTTDSTKNDIGQDGVKSFAMLKDDDLSPARLTEQGSEASATADPASEDQVNIAGMSSTSAASATGVERNTSSVEQSQVATASVNLPTHYTILVHDPETGKLSITSSTAGPPRDTSPPLPLHKALAALSYPAKFIPFITGDLEVQSAGPHMLVLRDSLSDTTTTRSFETVHTTNAIEAGQTGNVNPIDGTSRLSPTGYVGPEESQEQLEKEFEERRLAARKLSSKKRPSTKPFDKPKEEVKKKRSAGGVVKTAIWAAAVCYVAGVIGEIVS